MYYPLTPILRWVSLSFIPYQYIHYSSYLIINLWLESIVPWQKTFLLCKWAAQTADMQQFSMFTIAPDLYNCWHIARVDFSVFLILSLSYALILSGPPLTLVLFGDGTTQHTKLKMKLASGLHGIEQKQVYSKTAIIFPCYFIEWELWPMPYISANSFSHNA